MSVFHENIDSNGSSGCVNTGEELSEELDNILREKFNVEFDEDITGTNRKVGQIDIGAYELQ